MFHARTFLLFGAALLLFTVRASAIAESAAENPLVGTWMLVKYVDTPDNGEPIFVDHTRAQRKHSELA
jgi:hypothetical protein